jgi:hypothetical protein
MPCTDALLSRSRFDPDNRLQLAAGHHSDAERERQLLVDAKEFLADPVAGPEVGDNMSAVMAAWLLHRDDIDLSQVKRLTVTIWRPYTEYPGTSFKGPDPGFRRSAESAAAG